MSATSSSPPGPVLFAYDGSELAALAIAEAGQLLRADQDALVVCVWQPFDVGFMPVDGELFNVEQTPTVKTAAERAAAKGATLAEAAGFRAGSVAVEAAPTWKGIVELAEERDASVIVLGSHGRSGVAAVLVGSVAAAVSTHSQRSVLITHKRS